MRYRVLALVLTIGLPGCATSNFGAPGLHDNAEAPAWRRSAPALLPLQRLPSPVDSERA